jgi:hypothetical protein
VFFKKTVFTDTRKHSHDKSCGTTEVLGGKKKTERTRGLLLDTKTQTQGTQSQLRVGENAILFAKKRRVIKNRLWFLCTLKRGQTKGERWGQNKASKMHCKQTAASGAWLP